MKVTGRRRWRRLAKAWRHDERKCGSRVAPGGGAYIRRHHTAEEGPHYDCKYSALGHSRSIGCGVPPPRPFAARSLCGMSMSARKRKARRAREAVFALLAGKPADPAKLGLLRSIYRIGERLRPCQGCSMCQPCAVCGKPSACVGLYDPIHVSQRPEPACDDCCGHGCEDGHCDKRDEGEPRCDGSGVLTAGGRNVV